MYPLAIETVYPAAMAAAVVVGLVAWVAQASRAGMGVARPLGGALLVALGGVVGGRVHWLAEHGFDVALREALMPGFRHPGIIIGMLLALPLSQWCFGTVPLRRAVDLGAPCIALAFAVGRIGCFLAGCCFGVRSDLPWALSFPEHSDAARVHHFHDWAPATLAGSLPVHPLQLYLLLLSLATAVLLLWWERRKAYDGQVFLLFIAVQETGKFLLEGLREPALGHGPSLVPTISLVLAILAWATLALLARTRHRAAGRPPDGALGLQRPS